MNYWENVESYYATADKDSAYKEMCEDALPYEFFYCVLSSSLVKAKGQCVVILTPIAYWNKFGHIPNCPLFIDDILPNLTPSLDIENEWYSTQSMEVVKETMNRLGYVESKEIEAFFTNIYESVR